MGTTFQRPASIQPQTKSESVNDGGFDTLLPFMNLCEKTAVPANIDAPFLL
jgi:hypothetical protein